ncbi:hypothetical protein [Cytobacillus oceanisediminis]|uniref:hypothetical protein n=1 Tax=Cytobacillus oceanisediminis TaxID=665099 RepID=UPI00254A95B8|nr:hypothetical protein [Cytobacillus oceanisediminis]MDK7669178.1 hypothetical protein [Cytobacillus oceanisediminis]
MSLYEKMINKINRIYQILLTTIFLIVFCIIYYFYIKYFGSIINNFTSSKFIINGYFIISISLLLLNYFLPKTALSFAQNLLLVVSTVLIGSALTIPYFGVPVLVIDFAVDNYTNYESMNGRLSFFVGIIASSTVATGIIVYLIKFVLNQLKKNDKICKPPFSIIILNIDPIFQVFFLIIIIISALLTFVVSFVPLFYPILDTQGHPLPLDARLFIVLIVLVQAVLHTQISEAYSKFSKFRR